MIDLFITKLKNWCVTESNIKAVALVGSYARGTARADSDIDIIVICSEPTAFLQSPEWLSNFGEVQNVQLEDWGLVQSWRVFYTDGTEVEFGLTSERWCSDAEIGSGTGRVIHDGADIVFDPHHLLADLKKSVATWNG